MEKACNITNNKVDQNFRDFDELINQPFVTKIIAWFIYFTTAAFAIIALFGVWKMLSKKLKKDNKSQPHYTPEEVQGLLSTIFQNYDQC